MRCVNGHYSFNRKPKNNITMICHVCCQPLVNAQTIPRNNASRHFRHRNAPRCRYPEGCL